MAERAEHLRRLKALREELTAITKRSLSTLTEIAKIQVRIQQLTESLQRSGAPAEHRNPRSGGLGSK